MPYLRITLKCLKRKTFDLEPRSLGDHIRKRRLELGLTQRQAGERLEISEWTVANWEKGHTKPAARAQKTVTAFLGCDPDPSTM